MKTRLCCDCVGGGKEGQDRTGKERKGKGRKSRLKLKFREMIGSSFRRCVTKTMMMVMIVMVGGDGISDVGCGTVRKAGL